MLMALKVFLIAELNLYFTKSLFYRSKINSHDVYVVKKETNEEGFCVMKYLVPNNKFSEVIPKVLIKTGNETVKSRGKRYPRDKRLKSNQKYVSDKEGHFINLILDYKVKSKNNE